MRRKPAKEKIKEVPPKGFDQHMLVFWGTLWMKNPPQPQHAMVENFLGFVEGDSFFLKGSYRDPSKSP